LVMMVLTIWHTKASGDLIDVLSVALLSGWLMVNAAIWVWLMVRDARHKREARHGVNTGF